MKISKKTEISTSGETIKEAVSTEIGIQGWWCKNCEVSQQAGGKSTLNFVKEGKPVRMVFRTDYVSDHQVVWTCTENPNPAWLDSLIVWSWNDSGHLSLDHTNIKDEHRGRPEVTSTEQGWDHFMKSLAQYCETGVGEPW